MPDGNRLTIFYEHCGLFGAWGPIGELLTQQYKAIGIDLQVKEMGRDLFYERFQARQTDIGIWTGAFDVNPMLNPSLYLPYKRSAAKWAPDYALWHESGGKKGTEPPPGSDVRKVIDIWDHLVTTVTQEEHVQLFHQILEIAMDNMWTIGVCTPPIQPVIVKNNFRNVPEKAISTYGLLSPGATAPEQYFIRQA
jgi:peptide/nickel transport system substrate-binding protein